MNHYYDRLESRIDWVLQQNKSTFQEIVRECKGAYPIDILQILESKKYQQTTEQAVFYQNPQKDDKKGLLTEQIDNNPVLCSWYFSIPTCERMAELYPWKGKKLLFLGMPRLFEYFMEHTEGADCTLVDLDACVTAALEERYSCDRSHRIVCADINALDFRLEGTYDMIFLDPPWYMEYYDRWIAQAYRLLEKKNGILLFALFQELTRPGADEQRKALLHKLESDAGECLEISDYIEYEIPTFERRELQNCGIALDQPWKRADLIIIKGLHGYEEGTFEDTEKPKQWDEVALFDTRVFICRECGKEEEEVRIRYLTENAPYLRNPSKRNEERRSANMLTSKGQGYRVQSAGKLLLILRGLRKKEEDGADVDTALEGICMDERSREILLELFGGKRC